eukprot:scaffold175839_cov17-Tisochrysis_lutea.AAC.1
MSLWHPYNSLTALSSACSMSTIMQAKPKQLCQLAHLFRGHVIYDEVPRSAALSLHELQRERSKRKKT